MLEALTRQYHLHPIVDHFTIALLAVGFAAEFLAAAAALLSRWGMGWLRAWAEKLRNTALLLVIGGAAATIISYFTGDAEADRLWDTMSPAAQQILASTEGTGQYLSHAILGQYLMYAFLILAAWRVLIEFSTWLARWRIAFLMAGAIAVGGLLYQGKTGGELVYEHGVVWLGRPEARKMTPVLPATRTGERHRWVRHLAERSLRIAENYRMHDAPAVRSRMQPPGRPE